MGFSKGAVAAIYSSNERFRAAYGPSNAEFAAHIGLYTPCNVTYKQDNKVGNKPIRFFHGIADDYVSIEPCRSYVKRLKEAGADVTLKEYPDAYHAYDNFTLASSVATSECTNHEELPNHSSEKTGPSSTTEPTSPTVSMTLVSNAGLTSGITKPRIKLRSRR